MIRVTRVKILQFHVICVEISLQHFSVKMKGHDKSERSQGLTFSCNLCTNLIANFFLSK